MNTYGLCGRLCNDSDFDGNMRRKRKGREGAEEVGEDSRHMCSLVFETTWDLSVEITVHKVERDIFLNNALLIFDDGKN